MSTLPDELIARYCLWVNILHMMFVLCICRCGGAAEKNRAIISRKGSFVEKI